MKKLWMDEGGALLSVELILLMVILVIGLICGMQSLRTAIVTKLADVAGAVCAIDPTFGYSGTSYVAAGTMATDAYTNGAEYIGAVNATDVSAAIAIDVLLVNTNTTGGGDQIIEQDAP